MLLTTLVSVELVELYNLHGERPPAIVRDVAAVLQLVR